MENSLTIGKLAKLANVNVETIRFYENKGILTRPTKKKGQFRVYSENYISKLNFIKKTKELGFTLKEIKDLLVLDQDENSTCKNVGDKALNKLEEIQDKINSLKLIEKRLKKIIKTCDNELDQRACCKVSDCLDSKC